MLVRLFAIAALAISATTVWFACTARSALTLRQEGGDTAYWPRHGTYPSGYYQGGVWVMPSNRAQYRGFRGGGPGAGK